MVIEKTSKHFAVAIELGNVADTTAVAIVQHVKSPANGPQGKGEEWHVRHLDRSPSGTYPLEIAAHLSKHLGQLQATEEKEKTEHNVIRDVVLQIDLIVDQTAVGEPVADVVLESLSRYGRRVIISGTHSVSYSDGADHIPKQTLTSTVAAMLAVGHLKIGEDVRGKKELIEELIRYNGRSTSTSGLAVNTWREQPADDLVFAVALACWQLKQCGFSYEFI